MSEKLVIICTYGPENPEKATIPFVMATAALASEVDVTMAFQSNAVLLGKKDIALHVPEAGFTPLSDLIDVFIEEGGKIFLCGPCVTTRKLNPEDFLPDLKVVNAATLVKEVMSANATLVY